MLDPAVAALLTACRSAQVLVLTGAGISAESGIPTFRGPEGYWRVGSRNYQPEELATFAAFSQMPDEIWSWYLYRRGVCFAAKPNAAHLALVELERTLGDRFLLVTQNVDGLHGRAGSQRVYAIHGDIGSMRCAKECGAPIAAIPAGVDVAWAKERRVGDAERALLRCGRCGARSRPHVLWFDETYDEERFRFESSLHAAAGAGLVVIVGTSGATTLPSHIANLAARREVPLVVINPDPSPFTALAERSPRGAVLSGTATQFVPEVVAALVSA